LPASAADCMLTNGAQEAIVICLAGLVGRDQVVLAADPTYVGLTGPAEAFGFTVETIADDAHFVDRVEERIRTGVSRPIRAVYTVADFANPTGRVMTLAERQQLVALAAKHEFYVIEDAAYRRYRYSGEHLPTLCSLDRHGRVIYIESFAKTFLPGIRLAVMMAGAAENGSTLAQRLSWIKSYVSVASSPITQAILGGFLLEQEYRLSTWVEPRRLRVQQNRNAMLQALRTQAEHTSLDLAWSEPEGGFFLRAVVPFDFGTQEFLRCASDSGVVVMPMNFFSPAQSFPREIRLAFSNSTPAQIETGIARLASFFAN
jgi:(S)-3,5-dihydroxyphenylglycine transaminase